MKIRATFNVAEVIEDLDTFTEKVTRVAARRAVVKLRDQALVAGLRELAKLYGIPASKFRDYLSHRLVDAGPITATTTASGRALPVYDFSPSPSTPGYRPRSRGVSVRIKGKRILIPHAFIARMRSGLVGVFARGSYGGKGLSGALPTGESFGRFEFARGARKKANNKWGSTALPINQLLTFGPAEAFGSFQVTDSMQRRVEEQLWKVMQQEIRFAVMRAGR